MNAEQELVFAKYLVGIGAADADALKACLRTQAERSTPDQRVGLADVLVDQGVVPAEVLRGHLAQFEARISRCSRCQAYFFRPQSWQNDACPRCQGAVTDSSKTGLTGAFRRAQLAAPPPGAGRPGAGPPGGAQPSPSATPAGAPKRLDEPVTSFGEYDIVEAVAKGGMGVVYKARHRQLGRVVALKVLREGQRSSESHVKRFKREARAVGKLVHPNIVPVHEFGHEHGQYYFTMDFIEGPSLEKFLQDPERDFRRGIELIRDVARGLACAHHHGVVHRDIKPANVLLDPTGAGKITDFGLARTAEHESALTQEGELIGTPLYMSPEQVRGRVQDIDERSDTYSLGVVLYQHVTGRLPFLAQTMVDLQYRILHDEVPPPRAVNPKVDGALETIVFKCLEKERDARYQTAQELADDLDRWLGGQRIAARPPSMQGRILRRVRRHKHIAMAAVLVALGLGLGGGAIAYREWRGSAEEAERRVQRAREELDRSMRALRKAADTALEQAVTELRRGNMGDARGALERARVQLEDLAALGASELDATAVRAIREAAGVPATRRRWLLVSARAEAANKSADALARARAKLAELTAEAPEDLDAWLAYADVLASLGARDEADAALGRALGLAPGHLDARRMRGLLALQREHWDDADAELSAVIDGLTAEADVGRRAELGGLLILRASARRRLGRLDDAAADLRAALDLAPGSAAAYVERGELMRQRGQRFQAAQDFDRAVDLADEDEVQPLLSRARFLIEQGYFSRAREDLDAALSENDSLTEAYLWRGVTGYFALDEVERLIATGDTAASERDLARVAGRASADAELRAEALRWIGRLRRAQGRWGEAATAYRQAHELAPADVEALVGLGRAALEAEDVAAARAALEEAVRLDSGHAGARTGLGLVALAEDAPGRALVDLDAAVERAPHEVEALAARARAHLALGDPVRAARDYQAAMLGRVDGRDVRGFFRQGLKYIGLADEPEATHLMRERELTRAEHAFTFCVRLAPLHARAHVERARVYERLGTDPNSDARAQALDACASALAANPYALEAHLLRARVRLAGQSEVDWQLALADASRAIELGAQRAEYRRVRGLALLRLGRAGEAVVELELATRAAPGDALGFAALAEALAAAGRAEDAARAAERQRALAGGGLDAEVQRLADQAKALLEVDAAKAAQVLGEAIQLEPRAGALYLQRANAHLFSKGRQAAIRDLAAAFERSPVLLATLCERLSDLTEALSWEEAFRAAAGARPQGEVDPTAPSPAFLRGLLYVLRVESGYSEEGDALMGVDAFTEVLEDDPTNASAYCLRGLLLLRATDLTAARNDLATALLLDRHASAAHVYLAGVYTQRGRHDLALSTLEKAFELGYRDWTQLARDPALEPLRRRPEWKPLIAKARGAGADE